MCWKKCWVFYSWTDSETGCQPPEAIWGLQSPAKPCPCGTHCRFFIGDGAVKAFSGAGMNWSYQETGQLSQPLKALRVTRYPDYLGCAAAIRDRFETDNQLDL